MKILDTSTFVAIFNEAKKPDMFDTILQLGHELKIPYFAWKELTDANTLPSVNRLINEHKLERLKESSFQEIENFQLDYTNLGPGEIDVILTYIKLSEYTDNIYCILDDGDARKAASGLGIRHTGLIGLLKMLKERRIKSPNEINEILKLLKKGGFRIPKQIDI